MEKSIDHLPHARERVAEWGRAWADSGTLVLLLDFDGTLAPIVEKPEDAAISTDAQLAIDRLMNAGATIAIVSGRGLADARERLGLPSLAYAGNHGMEIEMPGLRQVHPEAAAARPSLDALVQRLEKELGAIAGAIIEDKGLTLSIHYRQVDRAAVERVRAAVHEAARFHAGLKVTEGKEVLEVRPDVDWHKGKAVEFLLEKMRPPEGAPILYIGDDRTDEDAFAALKGVGGGEGVLVSEGRPGETAASSFVETTKEVAKLLDLLADSRPRRGGSAVNEP